MSTPNRQDPPVRGVLGYGAYLPYRRLDRAAIAPVAGGGGGRGTRTVASFDEDTTTMGVEAARDALRAAPHVRPRSLLFATVAPAYADRTNATAVHAALRLPADVAAIDAAGSVRSAAGLLRLALDGGTSALVVASDLRGGLPGSGDEAAGGDGASALLVGSSDDGPVLAEYLGGASATAEFVDRWRAPGEARSKLWEDKFGEKHYLAAGRQAWTDALKNVGLTADQVDHVAVTGLHARAVAGLGRSLGVRDGVLADGLGATVGVTGAAHPGLLLASELDTLAETGGSAADRIVAVVVLSDGAEVFVFRTTDALEAYTPARPVADQVAGGAPIPYGTFLAWRGMLPVEPPRRPEPARTSSSAAARSAEWKFGFVGSRDRSSGAVHLPPARVSMRGGAVDDMEPVPMADAVGTVKTFTIDRMAYSPSPPVVFAVVDFDRGGRLPIELTDVDADRVRVGDRVEPTFRRVGTADGIHNYFWKARPVRDAAPTRSAQSAREA
ncbi:OB-fold domain-containing protein [Yinghuangia sp. ASG 101]|uniref:OB-fold domain-containing protein n=1 Tax=Yinghuangia sp. ASG 101 TaxID=2896848 RepID=UPI001E2DDB69|nr:OB-fold domain-containing protein [Yinghuangia sp. ASG 101]UGQ10618.1 OB-fold domain-containing protein [Yinghuangia sp. ASG 101]